MSDTRISVVPEQSTPVRTVDELVRGYDAAVCGAQLHGWIRELYPFCRSITGDGLRATLRWVRQHVPLQITEVASGTRVFDWTVPDEWNIADAYIKNEAGERVVDFRRCNLHVVGYSIPVHRKLTKAELAEHVFTLPEHPDWIPYRTSYCRPTWGFCLSQRQWEALPEGTYEVCIQSQLAPGHLSYGELYLPGRQSEEVLISTHACHPSMCNDNLSGVVVSTMLARVMASAQRRYGYRFVFVPGTFGSITWLARNEDHVECIRHGLVLACLGDSGPMRYKRSRRGRAEIDRVAEAILADGGRSASVRDFEPFGDDERQYCSPGFNLPVGTLSRSPYGTFPECHSSADDLDFVRPEALADSLLACLRIIQFLERNEVWINTQPKCEPQLGRRGLFEPAWAADAARARMAIQWVLNLADGQHSLLDIRERSGLDTPLLFEAVDALRAVGLLAEAPVSVAHAASGPPVRARGR